MVFQAPPIYQRILIGAFRVLAQRTDSSLDVLTFQGIDNVFRIQLVLGHLLRVHPDAHAIDIAHQLDVSHTVNALQARLHVDVEIVGDEGIVVAVVGAFQGNDAQHALFFLLHLHTQFQHFGWQVALGLLHTVLHAYLCQVGVGAGAEGDVDGGHATAG